LQAKIASSIYSHPDSHIAQNWDMKKVDIRQAFAQNLSAHMRKQGLNQPELAARSGVSQSHLSEMLRGITKVSLDLVADLAFALKCDPWELIVDSDATRQNVLSKILGVSAAEPVEPQVETAKRRPPKKADGPRPGAE
jgi:transcriptional regulator with XRE-family HTH domain